MQHHVRAISNNLNVLLPLIDLPYRFMLRIWSAFNMRTLLYTVGLNHLLDYCINCYLICGLDLLVELLRTLTVFYTRTFLLIKSLHTLTVLNTQTLFTCRIIIFHMDSCYGGITPHIDSLLYADFLHSKYRSAH